MVAKLIKFHEETFTPKPSNYNPDPSPIPMVVIYLDVEGLNDPVKIQIKKDSCSGNPNTCSQVYVDCTPRYNSAGRMYWKPCLVKFA